jgi:carbonic anhydrase
MSLATKNKTPINIVGNVPNCSLKCNFSFKYPASRILKLLNKGKYINIGVERMSEPPVTFNNEGYSVQGVRIYTPSLHTYSGANADAELIIIHTNTNDSSYLLICIPISVNNIINDNSSLLSRIVQEMSKRANSIGEETILSEERFSLNDLVPRKPFFSYEGVLPYSPNNGNADFIVYNMENAIPINDKIFKQMRNMIVSQPTDVYPTNDRLFYNSSGPTVVGVNGDIYIDCRPTGSDGNVIIPVNEESNLNGSNIFGDMKSSDIYQFFLKVVLPILMASIVLFLMMKAIYMAINYGDKDAPAFTTFTVLNPFGSLFN